jgi:hypothetical protein
MAYCAEFYGAEGRAKVPLLVGFSVQFGCVINAGKLISQSIVELLYITYYIVDNRIGSRRITLDLSINI